MPRKSGLLVEAVELLAEAGVGGLEMADRADDDGVVLGDVEDPLRVFDERAGFDLDRAADAERLGEGAVARRQRGLVQRRVVFGRPRHAAGTGGVEEMNVRVDDRDRRRLCEAAPGAGRKVRRFIVSP